MPSPPLFQVPNASRPSKNDAVQASTSAIAEGGENKEKAGSDTADGSNADDELICCNEDVIENVLIPVPEVIDKCFFNKMSQLVGVACKCKTGTVQHPKWICEWDCYNIWDNIIEPNQQHIQWVMILSNAITE